MAAGIGLIVGLGLGALWRAIRKRPVKTTGGGVRVIPNPDRGQQRIEATGGLTGEVEIELRPIVDPGEVEIEGNAPLVSDE